MYKQLLQLHHIDIFQEQGHILLHDLINNKKFDDYQKILSTIKASSRNIWNSYPKIKPLCVSRALGKLALELSRLKSLRFGFDHLFPSMESLSSFFKEGKSLSQISSISHLEVALLLNLAQAPSASSATLFPIEPGSGLFFKPTTLLTLPQEPIDGPFLLITYCQINSRYLHNQDDPFTQDVKKERMGFGDLLSNAHHPVFSILLS